ncbi:MAG: Uma2 family endonuclease [Anaerolineae bacterium]|nr:Uma2 family endonuclease [Anaerolineae bacterium]
MTGVVTRITAAEFLALPETMQQTELLEGEIIVTPALIISHQEIVGQVYMLLRQLMIEGKSLLSPLDVWLDEINVVQPDVIWIAPDSPCVEVEGKYWQGPPDLVVKVLSPGTARTDKSTKFRLCERRGVREYWMVDPQAEYIEVWRRSGEQFELQGVYGPDETFESAVLDNKEIKGRAIFHQA